MMKNALNVSLYPSLICMDMGRLLDDVAAYRRHGFDTVHADLIDGHFSPSMPLSFHALRKVREEGGVKLDVHLMVEQEEYFLEETLNIGAQSVCFHMETVRHPQHWLDRIKSCGAQAGIALKPSTPISALECILSECDFVLLMLINPGYANTAGEKQVRYAAQKIAALRAACEALNPSCAIALDGRISPENIVEYAKLGASRFAVGTSCFTPGRSLEENAEKLKAALNAPIRHNAEGECG